MCHLLLLLPLITLPVFWLAPLSIAGPAYAAVLVVSGGVYFLSIRAMHQPVITGVEALAHASGEIIDKQGRFFYVRIQGEVWQAEADEQAAVGDRVEVVSIDRLTLKIRPVD